MSDRVSGASAGADRALLASLPEPVPVSALPGDDPSRDPYWDYEENECANCGGEGFTYGCSWDWQCDTYDEGEGTCLCTRRCHWCSPRKPDPALQTVLAEALAAESNVCLRPGCRHPRGTVCTYSLCHGRGYGQHLYAQGIEARRAETAKTGSVHESPVAESDAPERKYP